MARSNNRSRGGGGGNLSAIEQQQLETLRQIRDALGGSDVGRQGLAGASSAGRGLGDLLNPFSGAFEGFSRPRRVGGLASQALGQAGLANVRAGFARAGGLGVGVGIAARLGANVVQSVNQNAFDPLTTSEERNLSIASAVLPKFAEDLSGLTTQKQIASIQKQDVFGAISGAFNVGRPLETEEVKKIAEFSRRRAQGLVGRLEEGAEIIGGQVEKEKEQVFKALFDRNSTLDDIRSLMQDMVEEQRRANQQRGR